MFKFSQFELNTSVLAWILRKMKDGFENDGDTNFELKKSFLRMVSDENFMEEKGKPFRF